MDRCSDTYIFATVLIATFLLLYITPLYSQQENYRLEQIPLTGELSSFSGTCLFQDHEGFMWFGSTEGLYRYDGKNVKRFQNDPFDKASIIHNHIKSIVEDSVRNMWIGTNIGLSRYDKYLEKFERHEIGLHGISSFYADKIGNIWIGTQKNGLYKFEVNTGKICIYTTPEFFDPLCRYTIDMLMMDRFGSLWIQYGDSGLCRFDCKSESFEHFRDTPCSLRNLFEDQAGNLYLTSYCGLYQFNRQTRTFEIILNEPGNPDHLGKQMVRTLIEDHAGNFWIRTFDGIYKYNKEFKLIFKWVYPEKYTMEEPFWDISLSLFEDQAGTIWFFTREGICKLVRSDDVFSIINPNPTNSNLICDLLLINDDSLIIGLPSEHFYAYDISERNVKKYNSYGTQRLFFDSQAILWIATNHGLFRMVDPSSPITEFKHYLPVPGDSSSLPTKDVFDLFEDSDNRLWVACVGAMPCYYDRENDCFIRLINNPESQTPLPKNLSIRHEDKNKELWAIRGGVYKVYPPFIRISEHCIMPSDVVEYVPKTPMEGSFDFMVSQLDSRGTLWLGDIQLGLFKLEQDNPEEKNPQIHLTSYSTKDGLSSNEILCIQADQKGNIWLGTENGLSKFDPVSETFRNFYMQNGLPNNRFKRASAISSKGKLFFGTRLGVISFHPDSIRLNKQIPPVKIAELLLDNQGVIPAENSVLKQSIQFTERVRLSHDQNTITLRLAILNYIQPERNQYKYMMEGLDRDWVYSGQRNEVTYAGLKPGKYLFKTAGSNNDGFWNEKGATLSIEILPPPWLTGWAYAFYILLLAGIGILIWLYLVNKEKMHTAIEVERIEKENVRELDQVKSRFFTNISHEFRTPLTLIAGPVNDLLRSENRLKDQDRKLLGLVKRNTNKLHQLINQLLEISKLETGRIKLKVSDGDLSDYLRSIALSYLSLAEKNGIQYRVDVNKNSETVLFDPKKVEKITNNLISNALKFTPEGGSVRVSLIYIPHPSTGSISQAKITVLDTGPGIAAKEKEKVFDRFYQVVSHEGMFTEGTGIGLALVKEIVDLYRGEIKLESEVGKGSAFSVILPVSREFFREDEIAEVASDSKFHQHLEQHISGEEEVENLAGKDLMEEIGKDNPQILIVEDNSDLSVYISQSLAPNFQILDASNGLEGLKKARENIPDLVITDLMMPVMDGLEMCQSIKQDERTSHIPVIILTAKADQATKLESLETGADDFLLKPFDSSELKTRVNNLIEQRNKLRKKFSREFFLKDPYKEISTADEIFLEKISKIIMDHLADTDFSVEAFSRLAGLSSSQLYRKISGIARLTPSQFIRNLRLKHSLLLLEKGNGNIAQIAYEVGFHDHAYYSKCFRKLYGISPSEYTAGKRCKQTNITSHI